MAGTITTRKLISDALKAGLYAYMVDAYESEPAAAPEIFRVIPSTRQKEEIGRLSGIGMWKETGEGEPVDFSTPVQGPHATFIHKKYTAAIRISSEAVEDGLYGNIVQLEGRAFGKSARRTQEQVCANIFNLNPVIYDGKNFFSDSHTIAGGDQTFCNDYSLELTQDNLKTVMTVIMDTNAVDELGQKIIIRPRVLITSAALKYKALEILHSIGRPDTAYNDINVFNIDEGDRLRLIVWRYITSPTAWYVGEPQEGLIFFERKAPTLEDNNEFTTGDYLFKGEMRFSAGVTDWRYWIRGNS